MKRAFLLIAVPALLIALGFAQTPAASTNTDQNAIKGCLGGSDGNYTVLEDNTGHIFKITTSSVDLKPHLNHDITLIGHKASGASSTPADNSLAVTELKMISEHCAVAAAASTAPVTTPSETASTPAADTTPPAATASTPAADTTAPVVTVAPPAETVSTPAADATAPVATVSSHSETVSTPAARPRRRPQTPAAATTTPAVIASTPAATAVIPVATGSSSPEPASTPAAVAPTPTPASNGWSFWLLIVFGVLVVVIGTMFPFLNRWRKQKKLERTDAPNLSFNREVNTDQGERDKKGPRKAA